MPNKTLVNGGKRAAEFIFLMFLFLVTSILGCGRTLNETHDYVNYSETEYNVSVVDIQENEFHLIPELIDFILGEGVKCLIFRADILGDSIKYDLQKENVIIVESEINIEYSYFIDVSRKLVSNSDLYDSLQNFSCAAKAAFMVNPEIRPSIESAGARTFKIVHYGSDAEFLIGINDVKHYLFSEDVVILTSSINEQRYFTPNRFYGSHKDVFSSTLSESEDMTSSVVLANMIYSLIYFNASE